jgi:REP element-mobilizing transposase RayT
MAYDAEIHHRHSIRLRGWDYARPAAYFVTLCLEGNEHLFGKVVECAMQLSAYGRMVAACWNDLPRHYPHVRLDAFVVMPNHVHGIIEILNVGAGLKPAPTDVKKHHALSEIVRAFKTFSARRINRLRETAGKPLWQRNYYEHIVRNARELATIRDYIATNPVRWDTDPENPAATMARADPWLEGRV